MAKKSVKGGSGSNRPARKPADRRPRATKKTAAKKPAAKRKEIAAKPAETASPPASASFERLFADYTKEKFTETARTTSEKYIEALRNTYVRHGLALYVGAGVSKSIGLPTWPELIRALTVTVMSRRAVDTWWKTKLAEKVRLASELFAFRKTLKASPSVERPILMLARSIKDQLGNELPNFVASHLYNVSPVQEHLERMAAGARADAANAEAGEARPDELPSSPLLDAIVALARAERDVAGVQGIINYNFDDLLEEKLKEQSVRCATIRSGSDPRPTGALPCYHVHGVLPVQSFVRGELRPDNPELKKVIGNFVFSEDEYHTEYSDAYRWSNMTQMRLLSQHTGLFVGLSLEDPNLRRLLDVTYKQYPDQMNYAILPRKEPLSKGGETQQVILRNLFEEVESASFEKIGVRVIWVDDFKEIPRIINSIANVN